MQSSWQVCLADSVVACLSCKHAIKEQPKHTIRLAAGLLLGDSLQASGAYSATLCDRLVHTACRGTLAAFMLFAACNLHVASACSSLVSCKLQLVSSARLALTGPSPCTP